MRSSDSQGDEIGDESACCEDVPIQKVSTGRRPEDALFRETSDSSLIKVTHGITPRKANGAGEEEEEEVPCHHSHIICASRRALSRFPAAKR